MNWNFPNNGSGQNRGIEDSGIANFSGDAVKALTREICQNSLDAISIGETTVNIEFEMYNIKSDEIPGYYEYKNILESAKKYWSTTKSSKAINYLSEAVKKINENNCRVLRISDYNTIGLSGPYSNKIDDGWYALTKTDGGTTKSGEAGGSYGIGKNAPFKNSYFRLVFYRTLNENEEIAAQGLSRLVSFPKDFNDEIGTMTTGIGYFGNPEKNRPVECINKLDEINTRTEKGTDVFIYGFKDNENKCYEAICIEILENFMIAIETEKMSVKIGDIHINSKTLGDYMESYEVKLKEAYSYYLVLKQDKEVKVFNKNFHGLGNLSLRLLVDQTEKLNKKILITRTSGMKLFSLMRMPRSISFTGILEIQGKELNQYFREMETSSHDKWDESNHSNPKEAKKYVKELKDWVRESIISAGEYESDEEVEVTGLGGALQNEVELLKKANESRRETISDIKNEIIITTRKIEKNHNKGLFFENNNSKNETKDLLGTISKYGSSATTRTVGGKRTRKRANKEKHMGDVDKNGKDIVHKPLGKGKNHKIENVRIIKLSNKSYKMSFTLPKNITNGYIEVLSVGENSKSNKLKISATEPVYGCSELFLKKGNINFSNTSKDRNLCVKFSLLNQANFAMEVNVYEYN